MPITGTHPLIELATAPAPGSGLEELAVVIITAADVSANDPRVLISANIHGPEICPTIVAHRLIEQVEAASAAGKLKGTVVVYRAVALLACIPPWTGQVVACGPDRQSCS